MTEYLGIHSSLLVYLAMLQGDAIRDFADVGTIPADLYERFVGWVR